MNKLVNWIKENWRDPVWSKVISFIIISIITGIGTGIWSLIKNIPWLQTFEIIIKALFYKLLIPIYLIIIFVVFLGYFIVRASKNKKNKSESKSKLINKEQKTPKSRHLQSFDINTKTFKANGGIVPFPSTSFLTFDKGVFNIWAEVDNVHSQIYPHKRFMYIIGYSKGKGNPGNNPSLARYPSAWAISRITPTQNDHFGKWRFWCNNISNELTQIDFDGTLSGGWHAFSISWSKQKNYIKFIIDGKIVGQSEFKNWPTSIDKELSLGTWPTKQGVHNYEARIGPANFFETENYENCISEFLKQKPT